MLGPYLVTIVVMLVPVPKTSVVLGFIFRDNCYVRVTFKTKVMLGFLKIIVTLGPLLYLFVTLGQF